jgi:Xaa-Pro aminopeptidase
VTAAGLLGELEVAIDSKEQLECVGRNYDRERMLSVRKMTLDAMDRIARAVKPGMLEEDAVAQGRKILKEMGLLRGWHGVRVRFGPNTLKAFRAPSEPGTILRENDIFFVDIGPVWQKWEGDAGNTYVVGTDTEMHRCKRDVRVLFDRVQAKWRADSLTGRELYDFANAEASSMGWELNLDTSGHRLAEFPHEALYSGSLRAVNFAPTTDLWVLEIQIRHPERQIGAFYEDLLLDQVAVS